MNSDILRLHLVRNISYRLDCHNNVGFIILPAFLKPINKNGLINIHGYTRCIYRKICPQVR